MELCGTSGNVNGDGSKDEENDGQGQAIIHKPELNNITETGRRCE